MKLVLIILVILGALIGYGHHWVKSAPQKYYDLLLKGDNYNSWYVLDANSTKFLQATKIDKNAQERDIPNENLWKNFHFGDLSIPLPVENPFFYIVANLEYEKNKQSTKFGISVLNSQNEKISDIYFLPNSSFPSYMSTQPLFELPLVKKEIEQRTEDQIWKDAFTKDLEIEGMHWKEMLYNLYLLNFRMKILGNNISGFGEYPEYDWKVVNLNYANKDYTAELFLRKRGRRIHSFIMVNRKGDEQSHLIRKKMITDIDHIDTSDALSDILIKEFKGLEYIRQVDHEGMFYLLSAWSHNKMRKSILEEAIFYLERGQQNQLQLAPLYKYYYDRYGVVFSKKYVEGIELPSEILLKLKVAREKIKMDKADRLVPEAPAPKRESLEKQFEKIIDRTKVKKTRRSKIIRMD